MANFNGKVALVTGAGSGIGRQMALSIANGGGAVMCADIDEQGAQATAARVEEAGAKALAVGLDVTDSDAVKGALEKTVGTPLTDEALQSGIVRANRVRDRLRELRTAVFTAESAPLTVTIPVEPERSPM